MPQGRPTTEQLLARVARAHELGAVVLEQPQLNDRDRQERQGVDEDAAADEGRRALADLGGPGVIVHLVLPDGVVASTVTAGA